MPPVTCGGVAVTIQPHSLHSAVVEGGATRGTRAGVWQALRELAESPAVKEDPNTPWSVYVTEIGAAYRHTLTDRLQLLQQVQKLPSHAVAVLGFSNETELRQYLEQQQHLQLQQHNTCLRIFALITWPFWRVAWISNTTTTDIAIEYSE
jgi:hypothetical protein